MEAQQQLGGGGELGEAQGFQGGSGVLGGAHSPPASPLQIASLRFVFLINQDLIALIKAEAAKLAQQ